MRRTVQFAALLVTALTVTGCGAAAVIQTRSAEEAQIKGQIEPLFLEVQKECNAELQNHDLDPIRDKVKLTGVDPVPFSLLIINTVPTPQEREALIKWSADRASCASRLHQLFSTMPLPQSMSLEFQQQVRDGLIGFTNQVLQTSNFLTASLYNGNLTYGEFNKRRGEVVLKLSAEFRQWTAAIDAKDKARILEEAKAAQEQVDAAITLIRVAACANAKSHFAQVMCQ
jgi:hypothetical protein